MRTHKVLMDINSDGQLDLANWVGATDGVLVWDKNGNGTVTHESQYTFSDFAGTTDMARLRTGFDSNGDGASVAVFDAMVSYTDAWTSPQALSQLITTATAAQTLDLSHDGQVNTLDVLLAQVQQAEHQTLVVKADVLDVVNLHASGWSLKSANAVTVDGRSYDVWAHVSVQGSAANDAHVLIDPTTGCTRCCKALGAERVASVWHWATRFARMPVRGWAGVKFHFLVF